jgi:uncharacterized membrane protein YukC
MVDDLIMRTYRARVIIKLLLFSGGKGMEITFENVKYASRMYEELAMASRACKSAQHRLEFCSKRSYKIQKILGIFIISIILSLLIIGGVSFIWHMRINQYSELTHTEQQMLESIYRGWFIPVCIVWVVTIILIIPIASFAGSKIAQKDLRIAKEQYEVAKKRQDEIIETKSDILCVLPKNYRYPLAANFIADVLESGRAESLKEALNLYEEQLHRWRMENKMNKLIEEQTKSFTTIWYI